MKIAVRRESKLWMAPAAALALALVATGWAQEAVDAGDAEAVGQSADEEVFFEEELHIGLAVGLVFPCAVAAGGTGDSALRRSTMLYGVDLIGACGGASNTCGRPISSTAASARSTSGPSAGSSLEWTRWVGSRI